LGADVARFATQRPQRRMLKRWPLTGTQRHSIKQPCGRQSGCCTRQPCRWQCFAPRVVGVLVFS
jgi:hypothetical protein